jgi:hypothetical protein
MTHRLAVAITAAALLLASLGVLTSMTPLARADQAAPVTGVEPETPRQQNNAEWTIGAATFQSNYPAGFQFSIDAESGGGEIVSAKVEWAHRPQRPGQTRFVSRADGERDPATGRFTAVWEALLGNPVPPWVEVRYRWILRDAAGNEFATDEATADYADTSRGWVRHEGDEVIVFSTGLPDDMGQLVVQAVADQRQKYLDGWGAALPYRPRVILFGDMDSYREWQGFTTDTSSLGFVNVGLTSDAWGGTVQVVYGSAEELAYGTALHEIEHLHQYEFWAGRVSFLPGWFVEGDAEFYMLDTEPLFAMEYARARAADGTLPPLLQGYGPSITGDDPLEGYYLGLAFFRWMDEKWGITMHRRLMDLIGQDVPLVEALQTATGLTPEEIESAWRVWLGASPIAPTLFPTWTPPPFFPSPTPFKFNQ